MGEKISWEGTLLSVQPRIRLTRSFDERSHSYLGYSLLVEGAIDNEPRTFLVGIGQAAQAKHQFRAGDFVRGAAVPVVDPDLEAVDFYKASRLKLIGRSVTPPLAPPPWLGVPPELIVYRERGHRRLDPRTYESKCQTCIWCVRMPVEMIIDHWNPHVRRHRVETFCYGPKSCALYRAGATRKVPGRKGMSYEEEDWIDEESTAHRGEDD